MNILAIGAHPDDIEYGCGGTLLKYADRGASVYLLVMTEGSAGGDANVRRTEAEAAAKIINAKELFWGGHEDTRLRMTKELIDQIEKVIPQVEPTFIFVHHPEDTHQDHRTLAAATISATRYVKNVLFYEGPTSVDFKPSVFVDIHAVMAMKIDLLKAHRSQIKETHIGDLHILDVAHSTATFRGVQGRVKMAEGFVPLRLFVNI